jgi:hypothetical protein
MKYTALASSVVAVLLGTPFAKAQALADEHGAHHPEVATPSAAQTPAQGMSATAGPRMQDNMQKMQELMAKIHASKNAVERKQLLQQHSKAMLDQMDMMRGMGSGAGGMMGSGMKMGGGMQGGAGAAPGTKGGPPMDEGMMKQMMMNHQAMQGRMDMMEMMVGQMLQNQEAQQDAKPAK